MIIWQRMLLAMELIRKFLFTKNKTINGQFRKLQAKQAIQAIL